MKTLPHIWRSPYSRFDHGPSGLDETITANSVYTDTVLADIKARGFDAIWVHGLLHHIVRSTEFPEFGTCSEAHLSNMCELIERGARHGVRVYLYMQPPRGFRSDDRFWEANPDVQGAVSPWETGQGKWHRFCAMCTSSPRVKNYLRGSSAALGRELPGLGGVILITASEYIAHCYSRYPLVEYQETDAESIPPLGCPRCEQRGPEEVIGEVIRLVRDGLHSSNRDAQVIAWNWSWSFLEHDPCEKIIAGLPDNIILLVDFERGDSREILSKMRLLDEYSLSFAGPSQRFRNTLRLARKRRLPVMAKLQLGTTHELATVPNLPLLGNLYEKASQMRRLNIDGFMGCWNFGSMPSANGAAFNTFFTTEKLTSRETALRDFATEYFGDCDADLVREAWEVFGSAMLSFPFSIPFIYMAPTNYALGYALEPGPLSGRSVGHSHLDDERGDDLSTSLNSPYSIDEVIEGLGNVAREWGRGAQLLANALKDSKSDHAREEVANAWVCYHVWRSTLNAFRTYKLRCEWTDDKLAPYANIIADELKNIQLALPYVEADSRFGFHSEAHAYLFDAPRMKEKIRALQSQLALAMPVGTGLISRAK